MKKKGPFEETTAAHFLFKLMARVMENPLRRKINDPVRAIRAAREIHELVDSMSPRLERTVGQPIYLVVISN